MPLRKYHIKTLTPSKLIKWRKKNKLSQITLAEKLGVTTITVYRWEKGMREIPPFLHLALKYLELKGGDTKSSRDPGPRKIKKRKEVKR